SRSLWDEQRVVCRFATLHRNAVRYRNYWNDVAMANNFSGTTRQATLDDVYSLSPSLVMNVRYGYSRFASGHFPRRLGFDVSALGFPASTVSLLQSITRIFPRVDINGIARLAFEG